jgi:hypothetical protein
MRVTFHANAYPTPRQVALVCSLVEEQHITEAAAERWTDLERLIVYDYAIRAHLSASDNPVRVRPRPRLLDLT